MSRRTTGCLLVLALVVAQVAVLGAKTQSPSHLYSTWEGIELDKCASAWLIKRFVDKKATFRIFKQGKTITAGIPFDTPEAEYRRDRNECTFEAVLRKHKIKDPALERIGKIVWDAEMNVWGKKIVPESQGVNAVIMGMSRISKDEVACFEKCMPVFDALYAEFKARK